jgi:phenylacetate-CoA ligase
MMEIIGRMDDITKIRGVLFSPKTVEQLVRSEFHEIIEYELVVTREGAMDNILVRIEIDPELSKEEAEAVAKRLSERHKIKTNLSARVVVEPQGALPRYDLKAKRFKDKRGAH